MVDVMFSAMIDIMINGTFPGISGKYAHIILQYYEGRAFLRRILNFGFDRYLLLTF